MINICPKMTSRYYFFIQDDIIAKAIYNVIHQKHIPDMRLENLRDMEYIHALKLKEHWWNSAVKFSVKCSYNRLDIVVCDRWANVCAIADVSVPWR